MLITRTPTLIHLRASDIKALERICAERRDERPSTRRTRPPPPPRRPDDSSDGDSDDENRPPPRRGRTPPPLPPSPRQLPPPQPRRTRTVSHAPGFRIWAEQGVDPEEAQPEPPSPAQQTREPSTSWRRRFEDDETTQPTRPHDWRRQVERYIENSFSDPEDGATDVGTQPFSSRGPQWREPRGQTARPACERGNGGSLRRTREYTDLARIARGDRTPAGPATPSRLEDPFWEHTATTSGANTRRQPALEPAPSTPSASRRRQPLPLSFRLGTPPPLATRNPATFSPNTTSSDESYASSRRGYSSTPRSFGPPPPPPRRLREGVRSPPSLSTSREPRPRPIPVLVDVPWLPAPSTSTAPQREVLDPARLSAPPAAQSFGSSAAALAGPSAPSTAGGGPALSSPPASAGGRGLSSGSGTGGGPGSTARDTVNGPGLGALPHPPSIGGSSRHRDTPRDHRAASSSQPNVPFVRLPTSPHDPELTHPLPQRRTLPLPARRNLRSLMEDFHARRRRAQSTLPAPPLPRSAPRRRGEAMQPGPDWERSDGPSAPQVGSLSELPNPPARPAVSAASAMYAGSAPQNLAAMNGRQVSSAQQRSASMTAITQNENVSMTPGRRVGLIAPGRVTRTHAPVPRPAPGSSIPPRAGPPPSRLAMTRSTATAVAQVQRAPPSPPRPLDALPWRGTLIRGTTRREPEDENVAPAESPSRSAR